MKHRYTVIGTILYDDSYDGPQPSIRRVLAETPEQARYIAEARIDDHLENLDWYVPIAVVTGWKKVKAI